MSVKAYISHHVEARTRFYLPHERQNHELLAAIQEQLSQCPAVKEVQVNPLTGSILVFHEGNLSEVVQYAKQHDLFDIDPHLKKRRDWSNDLLSKVRSIDQKIIRATDGDMNLASLAALGLLGAGAFQLSRKQLFPAATSLITDAIRILLQVSQASAAQHNGHSNEPETEPIH